MLEYVAKGSYTPAKSIDRLIEKAVYEPLPDEIKDFVLTLCISDSFTHEQAGYMWGRENAGELLAEVVNKNAFVKYESKDKTYKMHNLFIGFLKEVLEPKDRYGI
jgi:LuxR family maltose regulon positive regulatory protein